MKRDLATKMIDVEPALRYVFQRDYIFLIFERSFAASHAMPQAFKDKNAQRQRHAGRGAIFGKAPPSLRRLLLPLHAYDATEIEVAMSSMILPHVAAWPSNTAMQDDAESCLYGLEERLMPQVAAR